jgi:hypothetical protein
MGMQLLVVEASARVVDNLRSHGATFARTGLHNDVLITFTYSLVKVLLKLINTLSAVKLLANEFVFSHVVIQFAN